MTSKALSRVSVKPLYNTIITIISPLSMLYLQKVLLIHLKKSVFYTSLWSVLVAEPTLEAKMEKRVYDKVKWRCRLSCLFK